MPESTNNPNSNCDAIFLGWQKKNEEDIFPLFNVMVEDHPLYRSTVSEATLRRLHLRIPQTRSPYPETTPAPCHDLGVRLNRPKTAREAIDMAGLNYTVVKKPLLSRPGAYINVRTDNGDILGVVNSGYKPVQNIDAFTFFDSLIAEGEATYETAGVLGKGERIWILARLSGDINVHGNDIVSKYLLLTNSHDGSPQVQVKITPIRLVCNNTLTSALLGAGDISISHEPNTATYLKQGSTLLGLSGALYEQLDVMFNDMANKKIAPDRLRMYVQALVPDNEESENTARTEKICNSVLKMHDSGRGAHLARGTVWGAFNSVAEYTDYMMSDEDSDTRLHSIWFGRGEKLKVKAFSLARRLMGHEGYRAPAS